MSHPNSFSLAHVLAAPWHQRRNAGGLWGIFVVVALCFSAPVVLLTWSLFLEPGRHAVLMRIAAGRSAWVGLAALLIAGWAMLVGNVLRQNHPTIARLVPHHTGQLRLALLVAWALVSLVAAALPGFAFDAPLGWACGVAAALALLAACLRWPVLWLLGIVAPFGVNWLTHRYGEAADFIEAIEAQWAAHQVLIAGVVVMAGAAVLTLLIRTGGTAHDASYQAARRLGRAVGTGLAGGAPATLPGWWRHFGTSAVRPYARWMAHLLARGDSSVTSRLLLGLGPATHWTTRVFEAFWYLVLSVGVCAAIDWFVGRGMFASVLPFLCFSLLSGVCTPTLQAVSRLPQSGREQALLMLLPGVPRGTRLNRWLAWQMSLTFVVAALCGVAVVVAFCAYADSLQPGVVADTAGGMLFALAAALLPQVAWQWRRWASMRGANGIREFLPTLMPFLLGGVAMALRWTLGVGYLTFGVVAMAASLLWCAWRWHRMASEPTAFPVGRLA